MATDVGFDEFVLSRSPALLRTAYLLVHDLQLAEDLVQSSLTKAWFAWHRIDGDPEPYVRRIMVTTAASWWRRRSSRETPLARVPEGATTGHAPFASRNTDLWDALDRLPRRQRAVIVLRYVEDLTESETAYLLGCSIGTVKSQGFKALAKLRLDSALSPVEDERSRP